MQIEPLGMIRITLGDKQYTYEPVIDITTFELAKIHQLLLLALIVPHVNFDYKEWVEKYELMRHFILE